MEIVIKVSAVSLIAAACAILLKKAVPEISYGISVLTAAVICLVSLGVLTPLKELAADMISKTGQSPAIFLPIIKCVGIALTVKIVSGLCRDAGQSAAAAAIEYSGCAAALIISVPLIRSMLSLLEELS